MNPLHDYIILELIPEEKASSFTLQEEEPSLAVGRVAETYNGNPSLTQGTKVLFKKYTFDEYRGQLIGKIENIIATL